MLLIETNHFFLEYIKEYNCLYYKEDGFIPSKVFRENMEKVVEFIKEKKATVLISDLTDSEVIAKEDQEWLVSEFIPKIIPLGISTPIAIFPTSIFGKLSAQAVEKSLKETNTLIPQLFQSKEEAFEWLKTQK